MSIDVDLNLDSSKILKFTKSGFYKTEDRIKKELLDEGSPFRIIMNEIYKVNESGANALYMFQWKHTSWYDYTIKNENLFRYLGIRVDKSSCENPHSVFYYGHAMVSLYWGFETIY